MRGPGDSGLEPTGTPTTVVEIGPPSRRDRGDAPATAGTKLAAALVLVAVVAWLAFVQDETIRPGSQVPGSAIALSGADPHGWELLESRGDTRPYFPEPMVWHGDRLCVGFSRVDFDLPSPRPSLARCVDSEAAQPLDRDSIMVVATVRSGNDTWQFIEVGSRIVDAEVRFVDGARLAAARSHIGSTTLAIRLPNHRGVEELRWRTATATYRCSPDPDAWQTGSWCSPPAGVE